MASSSDALDPEVEAVVAACMDVLRQTPSAVVTDIDGTVSAIAPHRPKRWSILAPKPR